jgi:anti-sigma B factor antagonist
MASEPVPTFSAHVEHRPDVVVIVAQGELDILGAPHLAAAMPGEGTTPVTIDLAGVEFMDSTGLRSLLEARTAAEEAGRPFALARPSPAVRRVLELVDLTGEFEVVDLP